MLTLMTFPHISLTWTSSHAFNLMMWDMSGHLLRIPSTLAVNCLFLQFAFVLDFTKNGSHWTAYMYMIVRKCMQWKGPVIWNVNGIGFWTWKKMYTGQCNYSQIQVWIQSCILPSPVRSLLHDFQIHLCMVSLLAMVSLLQCFLTLLLLQCNLSLRTPLKYGHPL